MNLQQFTNCDDLVTPRSSARSADERLSSPAGGSRRLAHVRCNEGLGRILHNAAQYERQSRS